MALTDSTARAEVLERYGLTDEVAADVTVTVYHSHDATKAQSNAEYIGTVFWGGKTADVASEVVLIGDDAAAAFTDADNVYTEWTGS